MSVKALLKQLSKEGFSIVRTANGYKVMRNQLLGSFSAVNGRPVNLYTINSRIPSEYCEGYQPGTYHYSCTRFIAALKQQAV
ncbi:hypothetical protein [Oligoflexus tunisiensis]|uniref:hypothetical protein n=1 Tax=Oligoflexus tunisiensis TaxID=708132 RepID=UPI00114D088D|nr:hypothetical protein [Oligoflexus tunisiensis]